MILLQFLEQTNRLIRGVGIPKCESVLTSSNSSISALSDAVRIGKVPQIVQGKDHRSLKAFLSNPEEKVEDIRSEDDGV
ncbi:hypothetical protein V3C99_016492 [Haemonchus contortus]